jgi:hypothetical protein
MKKKILFICGSLNQTMQMHGIAMHFPEYFCFFSPYYIGGFHDSLVNKVFNRSILGGNYRIQTEAYLNKNNLPVDYKGLQNAYDFVFTCQDLIIPANIRHTKIFLVQEGMTDHERLRYHLVKKLGFPRFVAGTAATGLSDAYTLFFVASEGYKDMFMNKGINPEKIRVTGIPNFDNAQSFLDNDFACKHYVLAITSNLREVMEHENRKQFIRNAQAIANGRMLIFKLHPGENHKRATREITTWAPEAIVLSFGNTNHLVANCDVLVARRSSVVYIALALGKEVHADIPHDVLHRMLPIQNNGTSAQRIAETTKRYLETLPDEYYTMYHNIHGRKPSPHYASRDYPRHEEVCA